MEARIYVVTGILPSGRTEVAEHLCGRFEKSVHLRGRIFKEMIVRGGSAMHRSYDEESLRQLNMRYEITALAAKTYFEAGFTVAVQDAYMGRQLPVFVELLKPCPVSVAVLCPDLDTLKKREAIQGKKGYLGFTIEETYAIFMNTTPPVGLWVDNSRITSEEAAERILAEAPLYEYGSPAALFGDNMDEGVFFQ